MSTENIFGANGNLPLDPSLPSSFTDPSGSFTNPFANDSMSPMGGAPQVSLFLAAPVLAPPQNLFNTDITLNKYVGLMNAAKLTLQDTLNTYDNAVRQTNLKVLGDQGSWAVTAAAKKDTINNLFATEQALYKQELAGAIAFNENVVKPYNDFLNSTTPFTQDMNQTQQQFAAGTITNAQYNAAVDVWNGAVDGVNTQLQAKYDIYSAAVSAYNLQVAANNSTINDINSARQALKITANLPPQQPASLASITLLPTGLPHDPLPASLPTVPDSFPLASLTDETTAVSSAITMPTPPAITPAEQTLFNSIQNSLDAIKNGSLDAYNKALAATDQQVATMRQAISDFGQGIIDQTTYNTAVSTYLAFATTANIQLSSLSAAYLADINNYNSTLPAINAQITTFNLSRPLSNQIPKQLLLQPPSGSMLLPTTIPSGPSPPAPDPFAAFSDVALPSAPTGSTTPSNINTYLGKYYALAFAASLQAKIAYDNILDNNANQTEFNLVTLPGKSKLAPNAGLDPQANIFVNEQGSAPGISGVGLTVLIAGIHSSALGSIITNQLLLATSKLLDGKALPPEVSDKVLAFALSALQETILVAAQKAGLLLSKFPSSLSPGNEAGAAALSAALTAEISSLINSGAVKDAIASYLTAAGFSPAEIAAIQDTFTAGVTLGLLQFTLSQVANLLNLPGLLPQVLGNLPSATADFQQQIISAVQNKQDAVLSNQASVTALKSVLTDSIASKSNLDSSLLKSEIDRAVNNALNDRAAIRSANDLRESLRTNFIKENFDTPTADQLAQRALEFVHNEQSVVNDLDSVYAKQSLNSSLQVSQDIKDAVARAQNNQFDTNRQFRGAIVNELQSQGKDLNTSYIIANDVLRSQLTQSESNRAVQNTAASSSTLNNEQILQSSVSQAITQSVINQTAINQHAINQANASQAEQNQSLNANVALNQPLNAAQAPTANNPPSQQDIANALALGQLEQTRKEIQATFFAALNATAVQNPNSEQQYNTTLVAELTSHGIDRTNAEQFANTIAQITGHEILRSALISDLYDRNALKNTLVGDFLDRNGLRQELVNAVVAKLQGVLNAPLADQLATQLATLIVGPINAAEIKNDTTQRTFSILDLLDAAHLKSQIVYTEKTKDQQIDNYRLFITQDPANELAASIAKLGDLMRDPANAFVNVVSIGSMPGVIGRKPTNYKESIDILI